MSLPFALALAVVLLIVATAAFPAAKRKRTPHLKAAVVAGATGFALVVTAAIAGPVLMR